MDDLDNPVRTSERLTRSELHDLQVLLNLAVESNDAELMRDVSAGKVTGIELAVRLLSKGATVEVIDLPGGGQAQKWTFTPLDRPVATRRFPVQREGMIPWELAERAYATYARLFGRGQSLERLAERAGFGADELGCLLAGHDPVDYLHHTPAVRNQERAAWVDQMQPRQHRELRP